MPLSLSGKKDSSADTQLRRLEGLKLNPQTHNLSVFQRLSSSSVRSTKLYSLMFWQVPEDPEKRTFHNTGIRWKSRHFNDLALPRVGWRNRAVGGCCRRDLPGWRDGAFQRHGMQGVLQDPERLQVLGRTPGYEAGAAATWKTLRESVRGRRGRAKGPVA